MPCCILNGSLKSEAVYAAAHLDRKHCNYLASPLHCKSARTLQFISPNRQSSPWAVLLLENSHNLDLLPEVVNRD